MTDETDVLAMLEAHGVKLTEVRAWTICYFPFTMGGDLWRPAGAKVPCERPVQIGEFFVCLVRGPDDMTAVCELTTGAIVGQTLEEVRRDIEVAYRRGDEAMMRKQVADAAAWRMKAGIMDIEPEDLWKRLANARRKAAA